MEHLSLRVEHCPLERASVTVIAAMHAVVVAAVGIEPAAVWLTVVWFLKSAPLIETLEAFAKVERPVTPQTSLVRPECDSPGYHWHEVLW